jgi:Epoxide hydrolase N terminus
MSSIVETATRPSSVPRRRSRRGPRRPAPADRRDALARKETVDDASQGVPLETIQELARYWAEEYDFGRLEAKLNDYPHFITEIDGLDIHFIHVRS